MEESKHTCDHGETSRLTAADEEPRDSPHSSIASIRSRRRATYRSGYAVLVIPVGLRRRTASLLKPAALGGTPHLLSPILTVRRAASRSADRCAGVLSPLRRGLLERCPQLLHLLPSRVSLLAEFVRLGLPPCRLLPGVLFGGSHVHLLLLEIRDLLAQPSKLGCCSAWRVGAATRALPRARRRPRRCSHLLAALLTLHGLHHQRVVRLVEPSGRYDGPSPAGRLQPPRHRACAAAWVSQLLPFLLTIIIPQVVQPAALVKLAHHP
mmetsp:Transcript_4369/g.14154  ORF Transcript_4369/g.14154 Transcript_4369/m.14154 type:complete len:266 (-) Transcript_4369:130-927(-)